MLLLIVRLTKEKLMKIKVKRTQAGNTVIKIKVPGTDVPVELAPNDVIKLLRTTQLDSSLRAEMERLQNFTPFPQGKMDEQEFDHWYTHLPDRFQDNYALKDLLKWLIGNAIQHGLIEKPVEVLTLSLRKFMCISGDVTCSSDEAKLMLSALKSIASDHAEILAPAGEKYLELATTEISNELVGRQVCNVLKRAGYAHIGSILYLNPRPLIKLRRNGLKVMAQAMIKLRAYIVDNYDFDLSQFPLFRD
jgi:hypothetical protein